MAIKLESYSSPISHYVELANEAEAVINPKDGLPVIGLIKKNYIERNLSTTQIQGALGEIQRAGANISDNLVYCDRFDLLILSYNDNQKS